MTVREFIDAHPGETLDLVTPEGYVCLEIPQIKALLAGKPVIAWPGSCKKVAYVQAEDLLEQEVCSTSQVRGLPRLYTSYDQMERKAQKQYPGMMRWRAI